MINYPNFDPIALKIGPIQVYWYGIMYLLGFIVAWLLARYRVKRFNLNWRLQEVEDLIFYAAIGVILGGRLGYMLFYSQGLWYRDPMSIFRVWEGGMSFHGGLAGVGLALLYFAKKTKRSFLSVTDFSVPIVPLGIGLGRLGNFINGELWGRITTQPWGMVFPKADALPRHPSQLYELVLEGVVLFVVVWLYANHRSRVACNREAAPSDPRLQATRLRSEGRTTGVFLIGYALCRTIAEFFREPDVQWGFLAFDWLTMGQLLSIPLFFVGLYLFWRSEQNENLS